jgi:hypothetical protein
MNKLVLDLFCGTKSLKKPAEDLGFDYFGIDIDPQFEPDLVADINDFYFFSSHEKWLPRTPYIIWASPPCTHFSVASIGKNWIKNKKGDPIPKTEQANEAITLVYRTLLLINNIHHRWWFLENPRGMLRNFETMQNRYEMDTVTYCQYGETRMKPTDIWHNNPNWHPKPACKNGDPFHDRAPRGSKLGTQGIKGAINRDKVPYALLYEILTACINNDKNSG